MWRNVHPDRPSSSGASDHRAWVRGVDTAPDDPDRHRHPRIPQGVGHEGRVHADAVQMGVEVLDHPRRHATLLPGEVLEREATGRVDGPRRPHLADGHVGVGHEGGPPVQGHHLGMDRQIGARGDVVARALGREQRYGDVGCPLETERQLPVHGGEAVTRLERSLDLDLEGRHVAFGPLHQATQGPGQVERGHPRHPRGLPVDQAGPQPGIGAQRLDRGGHGSRVLGPEQDAGAPERLGHGRRGVGHDRDPGRHGLEERNAEALVITQRDVHTGPGEHRPQLAVGDLPAELHPVLDPQPPGGEHHLLVVVLVGRAAHQVQAGAGVERAGVGGKRLDQQVLALVGGHPTDEQPVRRRRPAGQSRQFELRVVDPHGKDVDPAETGGQHLGPVVVGVGQAEQRAPRQETELIATEPAVPTGHRIVEEVLGRDVVVHRDDRVGQVQYVVEGVAAVGVVDDEELVVGTRVRPDRHDPSDQLGGDVLGEDLRLPAHAAQVALHVQHLVGDGVARRGPRVELVDGVEVGHLTAAIT